MITGKVQAERDQAGDIHLKPRISIRVAGVHRVFHDRDVTVDTGFTGGLTLPEETIEELGLTLYGRRPANHAEGVGMFEIYGALVSWHDEHRPVLVHKTSGDSLIGMALLKDSKLIVHAWEDGDVTIEIMDAK
jgi:predicted aspartyl protease